MMLVVSDTSPLNYLVLIGHVDVLPVLFQRVVTAPAVIAELQHGRAPPTVRHWTTSVPQWLEVQRPVQVIPDLKLGPGEAEAISLAQELGANAVLIDERNASRVAASLGLNVAGTLGVLMLAAERKLLQLPDAIDALRTTSFRASEELFQRALGRVRTGQ